MNEAKTNPQPSPPPRTAATTGYATASLVLGVLSVLMSFFLIGGVLGFIGITLGVHFLRRGTPPRTMAGWGVGLCIAGIVMTLSVSYVYYRGARMLIEKWSSSSSVDSGFPAWRGKPAPDISIQTLEGQTMQLSNLRGKKVVLDFWATWCPPCRKEIPHFIQLASEHSRDELVIIGISDEDEDTVRAFAANNHVNYTFATAQDLPEPYNQVTGIPTTFFIDRQGIIKNTVVGYHSYDALKKEALSDDWITP
ncbi:MAG: TlpA disulfide reductase family protein [bacterium]